MRLQGPVFEDQCERSFLLGPVDPPLAQMTVGGSPSAPQSDEVQGAVNPAGQGVRYRAVGAGRPEGSQPLWGSRRIADGL